jgi:hypothetical protein
VSTIEELERKVAAPVYKLRLRPQGIRRADYETPLYPQKSALTLPTSGGRSVGIVRSHAHATEFVVFLFFVVVVVCRSKHSPQISKLLFIITEFMDFVHRSKFQITRKHNVSEEQSVSFFR